MILIPSKPELYTWKNYQLINQVTILYWNSQTNLVKMFAFKILFNMDTEQTDTEKGQGQEPKAKTKMITLRRLRLVLIDRWGGTWIFRLHSSHLLTNQINQHPNTNFFFTYHKRWILKDVHGGAGKIGLALKNRMVLISIDSSWIRRRSTFPAPLMIPRRLLNLDNVAGFVNGRKRLNRWR